MAGVKQKVYQEWEGRNLAPYEKTAPDKSKLKASNKSVRPTRTTSLLSDDGFVVFELEKAGSSTPQDHSRGE
jgi:hypothetical protein